MVLPPEESQSDGALRTLASADRPSDCSARTLQGTVRRFLVLVLQRDLLTVVESITAPDEAFDTVTVRRSRPVPLTDSLSRLLSQLALVMLKLLLELLELLDRPSSATEVIGMLINNVRQLITAPQPLKILLFFIAILISAGTGSKVVPTKPTWPTEPAYN